jgi:adenylate kinase
MILLMGSAGAGKGTQGKLLLEKDGYSYISTGEILRSHANPEQQQRMLRGELLDNQEIIEMVDKALAALPDPDHCILDGIPRTITQAEWVLDQAAQGRFKKPIVINLDTTRDVVLSRLLLRGRPDDTEAGIAKRFEEHQNETLPVLAYFKEKGIPVFNVDAAASPEVVHENIVRILKTF